MPAKSTAGSVNGVGIGLSYVCELTKCRVRHDIGSFPAYDFLGKFSTQLFVEEDEKNRLSRKDQF